MTSTSGVTPKPFHDELLAGRPSRSGGGFVCSGPCPIRSPLCNQRSRRGVRRCATNLQRRAPCRLVGRGQTRSGLASAAMSVSLSQGERFSRQLCLNLIQNRSQARPFRPIDATQIRKLTALGMPLQRRLRLWKTQSVAFSH